MEESLIDIKKENYKLRNDIDQNINNNNKMKVEY